MELQISKHYSTFKMLYSLASARLNQILMTLCRHTALQEDGRGNPNPPAERVDKITKSAFGKNLIAGGWKVIKE